MQTMYQLFERLHSVTYRHELYKDSIKRSCGLLQNIVMFAARYMFRLVRAFSRICINITYLLHGAESCLRS
jgi:hypothetical protein